MSLMIFWQGNGPRWRQSVWGFKIQPKTCFLLTSPLKPFILSKYYAGKKVDLLPRVVGRLNGGSVPDYEFTTETVYENVMVLKVLFSSIQVYTTTIN